ncbi:sugar phosphate isomerase/epimerase, partial [Xanthomonas citri pv. citri]
MKTLKGPGIFLAQFLGDEAPLNTLDGITQYMADLGYKGVQLPIWDPRVIDIKQAAESQTYADELKGKLKEKGLEITELASHIIGQLVASHPV